jgi:hypothetical protein
MKKNSLIRYFTGLFIISAIIAGIEIFVFNTIYKSYYIPDYFLLLAFFIILTAIFHLILIKITSQNHYKFIAKFMLITIIKLLIYSIIIIIYILMRRTYIVNFLICFLSYYLIFSIYEVTSIINFMKKTKK